jgi:hypothetical protein
MLAKEAGRSCNYRDRLVIVLHVEPLGIPAYLFDLLHT